MTERWAPALNRSQQLEDDDATALAVGIFRRRFGAAHGLGWDLELRLLIADALVLLTLAYLLDDEGR